MSKIKKKIKEMAEGEDFPKDFGEDAQMLMSAIVDHNRAAIVAAEAIGISDANVMNALVSSFITLLANHLQCQHCATEVLRDVVKTMDGTGEKHNESVH
jgi:hypothetical protein